MFIISEKKFLCSYVNWVPGKLVIETNCKKYPQACGAYETELRTLGCLVEHRIRSHRIVATGDFLVNLSNTIDLLYRYIPEKDEANSILA